MGQKMKNAPVYFTIAQIRYNPVLSLDSYIPGIQECLRKAGYPDFQQGAVMTFNLAPVAGGNDAQGQAPTIVHVARYVFSNMERTRAFILEHNALSFQATKYDTFEAFSGELLKGLDILHKAVALDYSERVGVRYLDAVVPRSGEKLNEYLVREVLGVATRMKGVEVQHSFSETLVRIPPIGNVTARTIMQVGRPSFPPDLQPIGLKTDERFEHFSGHHAIIDTDGSFEGREAFDLGTLKGRLFSIHDEISKTFRATVTDHAMAVWK